MKELEKDFHRLKIRKGTYKYGLTLQIVKGYRVHTVISSTKWGCKEYTGEVIRIMDDLGVTYHIGNDASNGGKLGTYIEVTAANIRKYTIDKILSD